MSTIGKAAFSLLKSSPDVMELSNNQINPVVIPTGFKDRFVIFSRDKTKAAYLRGDPYKDEVTMVCTAYALDDYEAAEALGVAIREALEGKQGTFAGVEIQLVELLNCWDDVVEENKEVYYMSINVFKIEITKGTKS